MPHNPPHLGRDDVEADAREMDGELAHARVIRADHQFLRFSVRIKKGIVRFLFTLESQPS